MSSLQTRPLIDEINFYPGDTSISDLLHLRDESRRTLQRGNTDIFILTTAKSLGELLYIHIWHDNSGGDWYLR